MSLNQLILAVARIPRGEREADYDPYERVDELCVEHGWRAVQQALFAVLADDSAERAWPVCADGFWRAALHQDPIDVDRALAWLFYRLDPNTGGHELLRELVVKLRGLAPGQGYDPRADPPVAAIMQGLE